MLIVQKPSWVERCQLHNQWICAVMGRRCWPLQANRIAGGRLQEVGSSQISPAVDGVRCGLMAACEGLRDADARRPAPGNTDQLPGKVGKAAKNAVEA